MIDSKSYYFSKAFTILTSIVLYILLPACHRHEKWSRPPIALPQQWHQASTKHQTEQSLVSQDADYRAVWWQQLNDEILNHLIRRVLDQNYSLAVAKSKIDQAQSDRTIASAGLWPEINLDSSLQRGRLGYQTNDKLLDIFDANLNASWNSDIFGQNRYHRDAMQAQWQQAKFSHLAAEVAIVTETINHYIELREIQLQHQYSEKICALLSTLETLTQDLHQAGLISSQDVLNAKALLNIQRAQKNSYKSKIAIIIYQLENLCSVRPGYYQGLLGTEQALPHLPLNSLAHTPASVIANRPDVQQAERLLMVKTALSDAASTLVFPKINLLALFGLEDTSRSHNTVTWSLGGAITLPILNFGRIEAQIDKAKAEQNEAFILYQKTVLQALIEVEMALEELQQKTVRQNYFQATVDDYSQAAALTFERFKKGIAALQDVIDAYKFQFQAQSNYALCRAQQINAWVNLQKAVGASIH